MSGAGQRILQGLKDALAGDFASVTIDGVRWVRLPAGYAVVPVEPSQAMIEAGCKARSYDYNQDYFDEDEREEIRDFVRSEYRAMLSAARGEPRSTKTEGEG